MKTILISTLFLCFVFTVKSQNTSNLNEDGKHVVYYQNGKVKAQGNYVNNKREGEWLFYYENGKIALKKNFSKGEQIGEWCYYNQNGNLLLKVDDISKINESVEIAHYENNKLKTKNVFVNGKKQEDYINTKHIELNNKF